MTTQISSTAWNLLTPSDCCQPERLPAVPPPQSQSAVDFWRSLLGNDKCNRARPDAAASPAVSGGATDAVDGAGSGAGEGTKDTEAGATAAFSPEQSTTSLRGPQKPGRPDMVDGDRYIEETPSLLTPPLDAASREPSGRLATVGLMLWPGPEDELMVTDKKAGTSAAASALLPGDGRSLDPGAPVLCLSVMLTE